MPYLVLPLTADQILEQIIAFKQILPKILLLVHVFRFLNMSCSPFCHLVFCSTMYAPTIEPPPPPLPLTKEQFSCNHPKQASFIATVNVIVSFFLSSGLCTYTSC